MIAVPMLFIGTHSHVHKSELKYWSRLKLTYSRCLTFSLSVPDYSFLKAWF